MADFKQQMYRRLRSARQWVTRAEEAFDNNSDIRAELDLMLAQAEIQQAKEANRSHHWRYRYSVVRHGLAMGLAMTVAVTGLGGTYWWLHRQQDTVPRPSVSQTETVPVPEVKVRVEPGVVQSEPVKEIRPAESTLQTEPVAPSQSVDSNKMVEYQQKTREQPQQADKAITLPPAEMQKLVRAAGKSLRGQ
jgi:hypothetical protein